MSINAVSNGNPGMSPFHTMHTGKHHHTHAMQTQKQKHQADGSELLAAVDAAFRSYIKGCEAQNNALIDSVAGYALTPNGKGAMPVSKSDIAPFLALSVMA
jgi:hypothetical protein